MAATVTVRRFTGAQGSSDKWGLPTTKTDVTSVNSRLSSSDSPAPGTDNPIAIPAAGTNYSYWAHFGLSADSSPTGTIDNIRWYMDGANSFGHNATMKAVAAHLYVAATGTEGTTGDQLTLANHSGIFAGGASDAFGFTSGSPLALSGSLSNPDTGCFHDPVAAQIEAPSTATPGELDVDETGTFKYDET